MRLSHSPTPLQLADALLAIFDPLPLTSALVQNAPPALDSQEQPSPPPAPLAAHSRLLSATRDTWTGWTHRSCTILDTPRKHV